MYEWQWGLIILYRDVFLEGALFTLFITILVVIFGTIIGFGLAFLQLRKYPFFSILSKIYIDIFRALPVLVLLIWIYYVAPILFGLKFSAFTTVVIALSINLAAFVAETVRAGIESIPDTQYESGLALGMSYRQVIIRIIFPQAITNMIPNLIGLYINELKNSSLASVIGVNELLHRSNILISETFRPLEIYTAAALVYLIMILPSTYWSNKIEKKLIQYKLRIVDML